MTIQELLSELGKAIEAKDAEIAALKLTQLPTGIVDITMTGVGMNQVKFTKQ